MELGLGSSGGGGSGSRQSKEVSQKTIYIRIYIYIIIIIYYRLREGPKKNVKMCIYIHIWSKGWSICYYFFFCGGTDPPLDRILYIYVHIVFSFPRINHFLSMHSEALDFPRRSI